MDRGVKHVDVSHLLPAGTCEKRSGQAQTSVSMGTTVRHEDSSRLPLVLRKERCDDTVRRSCRLSVVIADVFFPETLTDKPEVYRPL